ncbi:hypothetical protein [Robertmurraya mangrovi]|nr:hypothetical protein [Bacillus sp. 31A1R]
MILYKNGLDFPYEGFIQHAIEAHFDMGGFIMEHLPHTDYAGVHTETGERWRIEAKGLTSAVGLDFRTGLGQLIQRMDEPEARYGIAIPNIPAYLKQVNQIKPWVREKFGLFILIVSEDGEVQYVYPNQPIYMEEC